MGCGWSAPNTDFSLVTSIEVANGGAEHTFPNVESILSGLPFWERRLNAGDVITAVGGSDNHDAGMAPNIASAVGRPTTVVEASELSEHAILEGIRLGRVFIDLDGTRDRVLDLNAVDGRDTAKMGGLLVVANDELVTFTAHLEGVAEGRLQVIEDGKTIDGPADPTVGPGVTERTFQIRTDWDKHWVRLNVRDAKGRLLLIGNPIYIGPYRGQVRFSRELSSPRPPSPPSPPRGKESPRH